MPARLRIGHKLTLALAVLLLTTVAVAVVGLSSVSDVNRRATALYADNIRTTETTSALWGGLYEAEESAFQLLLVSSAAERSELEDELDESVPKVESTIVALRQIHASDAPVQKARVEQIAAGWLEFERLWRSGALAPGDPKARRRATARVAAVLEPTTELAAALMATEGREARESQARAEATYRAARLRIVVLSVGSVLVCLLIALALIRDLVPRLRSYSRFAGRVADGQLGERLTPRGGDEVAELGRALDLMVGRREEQRAHEAAQAEFADTMQLSETEGEAHDLLKRHLERTIRGSRVTVLNRNNSADRLEAATPVEPECPLYASLQGAKPRACLAVRFGRVHQGGPDREPLLRCQVCSGLPEATTCEPLLVSGQVIGSVLVDHPAGTEVGAPIRESVMQAAPVLATCATWPSPRSGPPPTPSPACPTTARSRTRCGGWSPRRPARCRRCRRSCSTSTTSSTSTTPTATAAATRSWPRWPTLRSSLRESDFAGRYGGEEFLLLLPDTGKQPARVVAEKVRAAIEGIVMTNLDLRVTASLGVATLPDDCGDADTLIRAADRALYSAKGRGRNRVELFQSQRDQRAEPAPAGP